MPAQQDNTNQLVSWPFCNADGNNLQGRIPSEFSLLTALTHLNLAKNELNGLIPTEFGLMTNLRFLNLSEYLSIVLLFLVSRQQVLSLTAIAL